MEHFIEGDCIAYDCETVGLGVWHTDKPFAFSFSNKNLETKYFEFDIDPFTRQPVLGEEQEYQVEQMRKLLEDPKIRKIGHNIKFDNRMMERGYNIYVQGPIDDTMVMAHACNTLEGSLGLKQLADKYCEITNEDQQKLKKVVTRLRNRVKKLDWNIAFDIQPQPHGEGKPKAVVAADYWLPRACFKAGILPPEMEGAERLCEEYAVLDAVRTMLLYRMYNEYLIDQLNVREIYDLEMSLWPVVYAMETRGVCTDQPRIQAMMRQSVKEMDEIYPRLEAAAWPGFKPKTDEDVRKLFYEKLGFGITKLTAGGKKKEEHKKKPAVDKFVILSHIDHPVVRDLAIWKANFTAYGTFFSKFDRLSIPDTYGGSTALHCDYRQVGGGEKDQGGVATGRLSCSNPNLQNVMTPENTMAVHPLHVRPGFIPRPGHYWLCVDYEGMEIQMFAGISQEPFMMQAIAAGRSIHDEMTNRIWGGDNNEEAVKQAIRALSLDGTGIGTSPQVDHLWEEWGVTPDNVHEISDREKHDLAYGWLKVHKFDQVKAQKAIGRKNSKTTIKSMSFLKLYGGGAAKATLLLKCSVAEAQHTLDLYDELFPGVSQYFDYIMNKGRADGFITSMWGRRLEIDPRFAYRATNYMVQGSSADLMKRSMVRIHQWLRENGIDAHLIMTIHDEIVIEVRKEDLTKPFIRKVCGFMSDTEGHLPISMPVEPKVVVNNWSVKHGVQY